MKLLKLLPIVIAVALVTSLVGGCTRKEDRILGVWTDSKNSETMEFTKDKLIITTSRGMPAVAKWEWLGDKHDRILVTLTMNGREGTMTLEDIEFSGDEVTMSAPMFGKKDTYKRVE